MAASVGAESERWNVVLIVVERDGSLVLVVEPTRAAVPCPQCGELSRRQHTHGRSLPNASIVRWHDREANTQPEHAEVILMGVRASSGPWLASCKAHQPLSAADSEADR